MAESLFDTDDPVAAEVDRRIRELKGDPEELLRRFDRNGDGVLDARELRVMRDMLTREVELAALHDPQGEVIGGRYQVIAPIGQGGQGHTFLARDEESGEFVALKEIDFEGLGNWDAVDTFERESKVLGGLEHPSIPRMRETFRLEDQGELRLIMVQDFVEGTNLEARLREGELFDEARLRRYAEELLDVLVYLHSHSPAVVHRDVKPSNIIEGPGGTLSLVDFGAAQGSRRDHHVIGTSGYMAPEQLMGHAVAASDIYALGATLVHLATRRHPADLTDGIHLNWRRYANISDDFATWIDRLVDPAPDARFASAISARNVFHRRDRETQAPLVAKTWRAPKGSRLKVLHDEQGLAVRLPHGGLFVVTMLSAVGVLGALASWWDSDTHWLFGLAWVLIVLAVVYTWMGPRPTCIRKTSEAMLLEYRRAPATRLLPSSRITIGADLRGRPSLDLEMTDGETHQLYSGSLDHVVWLHGLLKRWIRETSEAK